MEEQISWSSEQILALAPDEQVAKAARALASPGKWHRPGRNGQALWGEHQGSGSEPYRVAVALDGPAFKCSCPSRKRPCKHALGLFLCLEAVPNGPLPSWVTEWLAGLHAKEEGKPVRPKAAPAVDAEAQARRAAQRLERVRQGAEALELWMDDLLRQGLGTLPCQPQSYWETQAARLVDAQAPGLARRVRELAALPASGDGWPERVLDRLARLHLLLEAFRRLDELPADVQDEVRAQIGWTQSQEELLGGPGQRDRWAVLARRVTEEERLRVQRTWLWGVTSRRTALLLDFAAPGQQLAAGLPPGAQIDAELAFWPGPYPLRALVKAQHGAGPLPALPGYPSLRAALAAYGSALALNPWLEPFPLVLEGIVPVRQGEGFAARDASGECLSLSLPPAEGWRLLALSAGAPLTLVAAWDGRHLLPLSAWTGDEMVALGGGA